MTQKSPIDNVTISITKDSVIVPRLPLVTSEHDWVGLHIADEVLIWIERSAAVDLIGAIVSASRMTPAPPNNAPPVPEVVDPDDIPF